jgi:hypothetical protein
MACAVDKGKDDSIDCFCESCLAGAVIAHVLAGNPIIDLIGEVSDEATADLLDGASFVCVGRTVNGQTVSRGTDLYFIT